MVTNSGFIEPDGHEEHLEDERLDDHGDSQREPRAARSSRARPGYAASSSVGCRGPLSVMAPSLGDRHAAGPVPGSAREPRMDGGAPGTLALHGQARRSPVRRRRHAARHQLPPRRRLGAGVPRRRARGHRHGRHPPADRPIAEELVEELVGSVDEAVVDRPQQALRRAAGRASSPARRPGGAPPRGGLRPLGGCGSVLATSGSGSDLEWMVPAIDAGDALTGHDHVRAASSTRNRRRTCSRGGVREHDLDQARTVMVGDTVWDVIAARRLGMRGDRPDQRRHRCGDLREAGATRCGPTPRSSWTGSTSP